jgi:hypothetical protein
VTTEPSHSGLVRSLGKRVWVKPPGVRISPAPQRIEKFILNMPTPSFELNNVLKLEAEELIVARDRAISIHHSGDIDAAGDEVEKKVREIIRRKLPLDYYIGHGHIVDEILNYNGQHDIIIADNSGSPILFKAENGTEYFPYESIYAVGEIKSTYYSSKKYFSTFVDKNKKLYAELTRTETAPSQFTKDLNLSTGGGILITDNDKRPYKSPIFKLMFFVDGGDFDFKQIVKVYSETEDKFLPNLVCILNRGIIVKARIDDKSTMGDVELFPEFINEEDSAKFKWVFVELGKDADPKAAHLAFVFFALNHHLRKCIVLRPNLLKYFKNLFVQNGGNIIA